MAAQTERGIPLSAVSPQFLHANSTSHTGPFSAIAELIDNAYDPDVSAQHFWIDKTVIKDQDCLIFMDNGKGMDYDKMHKMLSFGFSDKQTVKGRAPIGLYGNGFKSGSMRLGKDVIVFSKKENTMCVGLLSQTYLKVIRAENVIVPIVKFTNSGQTFDVAREYEMCLDDILAHSLFKTREELLTEFSAINGPYGSNSTGTRIIIWNLRKTSSGGLEFDFNKDRYDIQLPIDMNGSTSEPKKEPYSAISVPDSEYSLRAYSSILYLKPRMQIIIRGQKVKSQLISKSLAHIINDKYRPNCLKRGIKITFGYNTKNKDDYGLMMYHKNRLIKAYEHVACQRKANKTGVGVIGVLECNYLTPMHNKQDFDRTEEYRRTIQNVSVKLEEYWKEVRYRREKNQNCSIPVEDDIKRPDQNWVQCDKCMQWRKLPDGIDNALLPDKWFCHMNPDPQFRSCAVDEEPEDSDDEQQRYQKTYKQDEKNQKLQKEKKRWVQNPTKGTTDTLLISPSQRHAEFRYYTPSPISARKKRALGPSQENGKIKSLRLGRLFDSSPLETPLTSTASPEHCTSPNIINHDDDQAASKHNETVTKDYNDIIIIECTSSPRPKSATGIFDMTTVKYECRMNEDVGTQMELEESDTLGSIETTAEAVPSVSFRNIAIGTQTQQVPAVKEEKDSDGRKKEMSSKDGEINHFKSDKDLPSLERHTCTELKSINKETMLEEENREINTTKDTIKSEEELSHRKILDDKGGPGQTSAKLENSVLNVQEAQQQQDNLLELLEVVTKERDESHSELLCLRSQVEELRSQLLELNRSTLKKDRTDQNTQTCLEEAQDYQVLYLQGKDEIKQLQEELSRLKMETEEKERKASLEFDDLACQIDLLLQKIDSGNKEREELINKVESLGNEKCALLTSCEGLKEDLKEMTRENEKMKLCAKDRGVSTEFPVSSHESATTSSDYIQNILRELRKKVAHLLVTFVPALDIQQVNYDCNVIDEILTQVVDELSPAEA